MSNKYKAVDLFCGCGGMSLGFQEAGFKISSAFDNWDPAVQIYKQNFNHPIHQIDLLEPIAIETTTPDLSSLNYQPTLLPEGYTRHREIDSSGSRLIYYKNEAGQQLRYHYVYDTASTAMFTVAEGGTHSIIDINGYQADMLLFDDPETSNCILWTDENNCAHAVHAFLDEKDLIKLAESVNIVEG